MYIKYGALKFFLKKILYSFSILLGVVALVFIMFQGFGDPARMIVGQTGDKKTMDNIRKDLYLDQPKWKQFMLYLNDVSPICFHSQADIDKKKLNGFFGNDSNNIGHKGKIMRTNFF